MDLQNNIRDGNCCRIARRFPTSSLATLLVAFLLVHTTQAATILETRLRLPFEFTVSDGKDRWFTNAAGFFRVDGSSVQYSVWIPQGTAATNAFHISNFLGDESFSIILTFANIKELQAVNPTPFHLNPWATPATGSGTFDGDYDILNPPVISPSFITYEVYEGQLNDSYLAAFLRSGQDIVTTIPSQTIHPEIILLGPWSGRLGAIPEPTSALFLFVSLSALFIRRRDFPRN